jgi:flavin-dependent dehydrogenase
LDILELRPHLSQLEIQIPNESLIRWAQPHTEHVTRAQRGAGFLVDRGQFDAVLLRAAVGAGVRLLQPATVRRATRVGAYWQIDALINGTPSVIEANFLVDASGRNRWFLGSRQPVRESPPTVAVCGNLQVAPGHGTMLVEALRDGWCWGAPISRSRFSAMIFLNRERLRDLRPGTLESFWRSELGKAELFAPLSHAPLIGSVFASDATIYNVPDCIGATWIRVGEASFTLDPLSSSGVEKAMQSGLHAATVLHTMSRRPETREICARFFCDRHREVVATHSQWSSDFYREVERYASAAFWRERSMVRNGEAVPSRAAAVREPPSAMGSSSVRVSSDVSWDSEPCVVDDEIRLRTVMSHPSLERPVAFLEGVEVETLLKWVPESSNLDELVAHWSTQIPNRGAQRIASWMLAHQILATTA